LLREGVGNREESSETDPTVDWSEERGEMRDFRWTEGRELAALMAARGETWGEIAREVGVSTVAVWHWRQRPEFQARVAEHLAAFREVSRRHALQLAEKRVRELVGPQREEASEGQRSPRRRAESLPTTEPLRIIYVNDWRTADDGDP
jgi:hypothetical protein